MYKECKTDKSLQRRIKIEECLVSQMHVKDYEQIHVSDICRDAGISRNVFYRYFDTKADVLDAWLDRTLVFLDTPNYNHDITNDLLVGGTRQFIRYWYEKREITGLLIRHNMFDTLVQKGVNMALNAPHVKQMLGMKDSSLAEYRSQLFASYGIIAIMCDWQKRGFKETEDEMIELINNLLLKPLYSPEKLSINFSKHPV